MPGCASGWKYKRAAPGSGWLRTCSCCGDQHNLSALAGNPSSHVVEVVPGKKVDERSCGDCSYSVQTAGLLLIVNLTPPQKRVCKPTLLRCVGD